MPDQTPASSVGVRLPWQDDIVPADLPATVLRDEREFEVHDVTGAYPLGWVPRPAPEVASSWLRQVTLLDVDGVRVRLQARLGEPALAGVAGDQFADRPAPEWPLSEPLLVIGGVRGPSVVYPDEAEGSRDEILRQLALFGVAAHRAWTVDRGHLWNEPSVIAFPHPAEPLSDWRDRALDIARQMGIGTVVQLAHGLWTVLALGDLPSNRYSAILGVPASVTQDAERRCPMQTAPRKGDYCHMRGGPWTSSSIRAGTGWFDHRNLLVDAVGCDTCQGERYWFAGQVRTSGGPIRIVPSPMPTRWLDADETELDQGADHEQS